MTLLIPEEVHLELLDRSLLIQQQERSDFGIGVILQDSENDGSGKDALIEIIPISKMWPGDCRIIDNYGGTDKIEIDSSGGALWPPRVLDKSKSYLKMKMSPRFDLYCTKGFWESIRRFNQLQESNATYGIWKNPEIDDYLIRAADTGELQLAPIFIRPYNPDFNPDSFMSSLEITKDFPTASEILFQKLLGADQTIIYSSRLSQICNQAYMRTLLNPTEAEIEGVDLPKKFNDIRIGQYVELCDRIERLRQQQLEADFDYHLI